MTDSEEVLAIEFGEDTEPLWQAVLTDISEEVLAKTEIRRELAEPIDLASEPTTIMVVVAGLSLPYICRCIERFLENRRQRHSGELILRAYTANSKCGEAMAKLQLKNADVIRYSPIAKPLSLEDIKPSSLPAASESEDEVKR